MNAKDIAKKYGMLSADEVDLIQSVCINLPPNPVIVNIGAGAGTSACAVLEIRPDAFVFSVDQDAAPLEDDALQATGLYGLHRCVRLLSRSQRLHHFPFDLDMVFVDGNHSDDAVTQDINVWFPKVKLGGYIFFHDYEHTLPGLTKIVNERMKDQKLIGKARFLVVFKKFWEVSG